MYLGGEETRYWGTVMILATPELGSNPGLLRVLEVQSVAVERR